MTSDSLITKKTEEEDGMVYDDVIETSIEGRVEYKNGKIVKYQEPLIEVPTRTRVYASLRNFPLSELSNDSLEGEHFSDFEVGEIIIDRFFNGNPHAQSARLAEIAGLQMKIMTQTATEQDLARIGEISALYSDIQTFKNLFYD